MININKKEYEFFVVNSTISEGFISTLNLIEKKIAEIYIEYNKRLKENNSMDFDDLLLKPIELFNNHPVF